MNQRVIDMMKLQGNIKVKLMRHLPQETAHDLACEIFDMVMGSEIVDTCYEEEYKAMDSAAD